ncbi:Lysophospholipid acyltransferase 7 [Eufriesea mexicana]|uniref:Lysophospholipid acyltransferase 7 n=1 Tax=Eufriesea mexicana TaxID=516756 RepID=A0A310S9Y3_9HYME|nr:Lysophospholipid acyltransferase 7 [Eufriesea mexicana]
MWSDVIYVALLLFCVFIGFYYRKIEEPHVKKWIGTIIGVIITALVTGRHIFHPLIFTLINAIIITKLSPKKCHLVSFFFSFFYLLVISRLGDYIGLSVPLTHTNLILMILTLKLSGLAFEINASINPPADDSEGIMSDALKNVNILDVFHYGFSYMGPYYRYRTYWDHIHKPFSKYVDPWPLTLCKLKQIGCFIVLFFIMNYLYPTKYILTEEYAERSFLYRHLYMYPTFALFKLRMYIGMGLAECGCQMSGLGAYPSKCTPIQGLGPKDYKSTEALCKTPEKLENEELNFDTVYNMNVWKLEKCHSLRTAMKAWNGCVQYWFGVYVYKRFPLKNLRIIVTLALSAVWHGWAPGYFLCLCQIPLFMLSDDIIMKFYHRSKENSIAKIVWYALGWYVKTTCMAYLGVQFILLGFEDSMHYYKLVYFSGHIIAVLLYVMALYCRPYLLPKTTETMDKDK